MDLRPPGQHASHQRCSEPLCLGSATTGRSRPEAWAGKWGWVLCRASWRAAELPSSRPQEAQAAWALSHALCGRNKSQCADGPMTVTTPPSPQGPLLPDGSVSLHPTGLLLHPGLWRRPLVSGAGALTEASGPAGGLARGCPLMPAVEDSPQSASPVFLCWHYLNALFLPKRENFRAGETPEQLKVWDEEPGQHSTGRASGPEAGVQGGRSCASPSNQC